MKNKKISLIQLATKTKTPFFVFDSESFVKNITVFQNAFTRYYPKTLVFYSLKTNYHPSVCSQLVKQKIGVEVSSLNLFNIAQKHKIFPKSIIFNSSFTLSGDFKKITTHNPHSVVIDTKEESKKIVEIFKNKNIGFNLGIRFDPLLKGGKLGLQHKDVIKICSFLKSHNRNVDLIHFYMGTNVMDPSLYKEALLKTFSLISELKKKFSFDVKFLDIGGGFPSKIVLRESKRTINDYSKLITSMIKKLCKEMKIEAPTLIVEPGRFLVEDAFVGVGRVNAMKSKGTTNWLITDFSTTLLPVFKNANYEFANLTSRCKSHHYNISGSMNTSLETLKEDALLPKTKVGDLLGCKNCGAYSFQTYITKQESSPNVIDTK